MPSPAIEFDVGGRPVRVSNPGKIYFPAVGLSKLDVVSYYVAVGEGLLTAVRERPTTLHRFIDGVEGEAFYQKRMGKGVPETVRSVRITFPSGRPAEEFCPVHVADLAWAANLGTFDFHPWPVRRADVDRPDELRLDLDPQPGTDFADAAVVAGEVRAVLADLGWTGYPKTSGGRGIHVAVRIEPRWTFTEVRRATIAFARLLQRRRPDLVTTSWWKEERGERVFIDFNQAARDRTIASAYSVRGNPQATVSAPLDWDEITAADPDDFTVVTMPARFAERGDLLAPIDSVAHSLEPLLEQADRDERDHGLGDMPYPPDYPKMPGEPLRVQPSRKRRVTSEDSD
ncbi:MAG: DNA polymerase domain-containing protein [Geodermatophilaceae bacterium]|nr:DNA polymerase domain-containing protein [Geodermatophilaceae bacterium]